MVNDAKTARVGCSLRTVCRASSAKSFMWSAATIQGAKNVITGSNRIETKLPVICALKGKLETLLVDAEAVRHQALLTTTVRPVLGALQAAALHQISRTVSTALTKMSRHTVSHANYAKTAK